MTRVADRIQALLQVLVQSSNHKMIVMSGKNTRMMQRKPGSGKILLKKMDIMRIRDKNKKTLCRWRERNLRETTM